MQISTKRDSITVITQLQGITVVPREIKDCLCKTRSIMEDVRIIPFSYFTFLLEKGKGQIWQEFIKYL